MSKNKQAAKSQVICFVGISGKPGVGGTLKPLSEETLSGKIISNVEAKLRTESRYSAIHRDNLVQDPPMKNGKLRYPTPSEMKSEWGAFEGRLAGLKSNVVILLGGLVANFFREERTIRMVPCPFADGRLLKWAGIDESGALVLAVAHPSYVGIYARKRVGEYAEIIFQTLQNSLQQQNPAQA